MLKNLKTDQDHGEVRDNYRAKNDKDHFDRLERAINISFRWTFAVTFVYKYILVCWFCLKTVTCIIVYYYSFPSAIKNKTARWYKYCKNCLLLNFIQHYKMLTFTDKKKNFSPIFIIKDNLIWILTNLYFCENESY